MDDIHRRIYLQALGVATGAAAGVLAGCRFLDPSDDEPTPTFGYGGTPTATPTDRTATATPSATPTPTAKPPTETPQATPSSTPSPTATATPESTTTDWSISIDGSAGDGDTPTVDPSFGTQGYGEYGYGGTL